MIERELGRIYSFNLVKSKENFRLYILFPKSIYSVCWLKEKSKKTIADWSNWCHGTLRYPKCIPTFLGLSLPTFQNIDKPHLDLFYLNSTFAHRWVTDRIEIDLTFQRWQTDAWGHCWKSHFFLFMLYIGWVYNQAWLLPSLGKLIKSYSDGQTCGLFLMYLSLWSLLVNRSRGTFLSLVAAAGINNSKS